MKTVQSFAFSNCEALEYADLSAARGLKTLERFAFSSCERLGALLLNEGLETIGEDCFHMSGLRELTVPSTVGSIEKGAFADCQLL